MITLKEVVFKERLKNGVRSLTAVNDSILIVKSGQIIKLFVGKKKNAPKFAGNKTNC